LSRWLLIRHGESTANAARLLSGSQDVPLTERGRRQAEAVGLSMGPSGVARAICSDLQRARNTGELALGAWSERWEEHPPALYADAAFRERDFGSYQGVDKDLLRARGIMPQLQRWHGTPAGVESYAELARRVLPALDAWQLPGTQVLFAHGGVIRLVLGFAGLSDLHEIPKIRVENAIPAAVETPEGGWAPLLGRLDGLPWGI
jgi:broad specificity phosphatase PhoE